MTVEPLIVTLFIISFTFAPALPVMGVSEGKKIYWEQVYEQREIKRNER